MLHGILVIIVIAVGTVLWLRHILHHDELSPEPLGEVLRIGLIGGLLSTQLAGTMNGLFESLTGLDVLGNELTVAQAAGAALYVGLVEESLKFASAVILTRNLREFDEPMDALIYSAAVALGYATIENFGYAFRYGLGAVFLRNFTAVPLHVGLSAIWGLGLARIQFGHPEDGAWRWLPYLAVAVVLHALYDFFSFSLGQSQWALANFLAVLMCFLLIKLMSGRLARMFRQMPPRPAERFAAGVCRTCDRPLDTTDFTLCSRCLGRLGLRGEKYVAGVVCRACLRPLDTTDFTLCSRCLVRLGLREDRRARPRDEGR